MIVRFLAAVSVAVTPIFALGQDSRAALQTMAMRGAEDSPWSGITKGAPGRCNRDSWVVRDGKRHRARCESVEISYKAHKPGYDDTYIILNGGNGRSIQLSGVWTRRDRLTIGNLVLDDSDAQPVSGTCIATFDRPSEEALKPHREPQGPGMPEIVYGGSFEVMDAPKPGAPPLMPIDCFSIVDERGDAIASVRFAG